MKRVGLERHPHQVQETIESLEATQNGLRPQTTYHSATIGLWSKAEFVRGETHPLYLVHGQVDLQTKINAWMSTIYYPALHARLHTQRWFMQKVCVGKIKTQFVWEGYIYIHGTFHLIVTTQPIMRVCQIAGSQSQAVIEIPVRLLHACSKA